MEAAQGSVDSLRERCRVRDQLVAVLLDGLDGLDGERERCRLACDLAGTRRHSLAVLLAQQPIRGSASLACHPQLAKFRRAVDMDQRKRVRELLEGAGLRTDYFVELLPSGALRGAVRAAAKLGCDVLIVPRLPLSLWSPSARTAQRFGLTLAEIRRQQIRISSAQRAGLASGRPVDTR